MYRIKRIFQIDYKRMFSTISKIAKRSHKPFLWILIDVIYCGLKFGAGYMDYFVFSFEELTNAQRATYITRTDNYNYIRTLNNRDYYYIFDDKPTFLKTYKEYIKRDYVYLKECTYDEYISFVNNHPVFIAKPVNGLCGIGVELIDSNNRDLKELYDSLNNSQQFLLEERIDQSDEMNSIYPEAINTIRVVTALKDGVCHIMFTALRMGDKGKHVDNFNNGGLFTVIDEDGVIRKPALNKEGEVFYSHPYTNKQLIDFKIPYFEEIIKQCKKMAFVTPQNGLTGWDMCVTKKGIDVVEGNQLPGYDIYQSKEHLNQDRIGLKPKFDKIINPKNS